MTLPPDFKLPAPGDDEIELVRSPEGGITRHKFVKRGRTIFGVKNTYIDTFLVSDTRVGLTQPSGHNVFSEEKVREYFSAPTPPHPFQHLVGKLILISHKSGRHDDQWIIRVDSVGDHRAIVKGAGHAIGYDDGWSPVTSSWSADAEDYHVHVIAEPIPSYEPF